MRAAQFHSAEVLGAPSRGRTGMTFRSTDFRTCYGFRRRADARLGSGVRHDHESPSELPLGPRRPLSTPAGCSKRSPDWLGVASGLPWGFADFDGIQQSVSAAAAQYFISPLRLPISPSGQARQCTLRRPAHAEMQKAASRPRRQGLEAADFRLASTSTYRAW